MALKSDLDDLKSQSECPSHSGRRTFITIAAQKISTVGGSVSRRPVISRSLEPEDDPAIRPNRSLRRIKNPKVQALCLIRHRVRDEERGTLRKARYAIRIEGMRKRAAPRRSRIAGLTSIEAAGEAEKLDPSSRDEGNIAKNT